jgi:hypothetical protein
MDIDPSLERALAGLLAKLRSLLALVSVDNEDIIVLAHVPHRHRFAAESHFSLMYAMTLFYVGGTWVIPLW